MPHILKELLYQLILYDYGTDNDDEEDGVIDLDDATVDQIEKVLGAYRNE